MAKKNIGVNIDDLVVDSDTDSQIDSEEEALFNRYLRDNDADAPISSMSTSSPSLHHTMSNKAPIASTSREPPILHRTMSNDTPIPSTSRGPPSARHTVSKEPIASTSRGPPILHRTMSDDTPIASTSRGPPSVCYTMSHDAPIASTSRDLPFLDCPMSYDRPIASTSRGPPSARHTISNDTPIASTSRGLPFLDCPMSDDRPIASTSRGPPSARHTISNDTPIASTSRDLPFLDCPMSDDRPIASTSRGPPSARHTISNDTPIASTSRDLPFLDCPMSDDRPIASTSRGPPSARHTISNDTPIASTSRDLPFLDCPMSDDRTVTSTSQGHPSFDHTISNSSHKQLEIRNESSDQVAQIDLALTANKELDERMEKLEICLTARLEECREKLRELKDSNDENKVFRYITCGRPYFKDRQGFPPPDNNDAKMVKSQMYDFSLIISVPGWTVKDKSQFLHMIHKMSKVMKKKELESKIATLERKNKSKIKLNSKKVETEIIAIKKVIDKIGTLPLSEVALPIDQEYDWDMLANKLNNRHTAQEYQSVWKLYFHPSINKAKWSNAEHASIQKIACENRYQDWDDIALKLNTGRTGYQCFVYYRTNMNNSYTGKKWTNEEISYLKRLIEFFKEDIYIPWGKVAAAMENRTKIQIYNKYLRLIEQRKGRFLPEEDAVILSYVKSFDKNFRRMTKYLPGRSLNQIRTRYQVLSKMRVSTVWSVEDDKKLVQLMTQQEPNMNFSTASQYFPGRNRTNIRTRYVTLTKWMKKHPHLDLEHAPRRGARRLNHGQASGTLNDAVENLKKSLNTTVQKKPKKTKITGKTPHKELNDAVVVLLVNLMVKENKVGSKKPSPEELLVIGPDHVVSYADLNITNLRKNIIFLNGRLDKPTYMKSHYKKKYPTLGESNHDVSLVKKKTYSRKNSNETILVTAISDVWGTPMFNIQGHRLLNMCGLRNYVLPPQLSTIIGARAIMAYVLENGQYTETINLPVLCKRTIILKELLDQALERFYILFTWPMILSNEGPIETTESNVPRTDSVFKRPPALPTAPEVTINAKCKKKFKNKHVSETIDLEEDEAMKIDIAFEEKMNIYEENIEKLLCDD